MGLTLGGQQRPPEEPHADVGAEGGVCQARPMVSEGLEAQSVWEGSPEEKRMGKPVRVAAHGSAGGEPRGEGYSSLIPSN